MKNTKKYWLCHKIVILFLRIRDTEDKELEKNAKKINDCRPTYEIIKMCKNIYIYKQRY